jgi:hypothetical protein
LYSLFLNESVVRTIAEIRGQGAGMRREMPEEPARARLVSAFLETPKLIKKNIHVKRKFS